MRRSITAPPSQSDGAPDTPLIADRIDNSDEGERFARLLGDAPCQLPPPTLEDLTRISAFVRSVWQVAPVVAERITAWGGESHAGAGAIQEIQDLAVSVRVLARIQTSLGARLSDALDRKRIPYALLKGSATRLVAYRDPGLRGGVDIDVGVAKPHLTEAENLAFELGFRPAVVDARDPQHFQPANRLTRLIATAGHYELGQLVRRQLVVGLNPDVEASIRRTIASPPAQWIPWHLVDDRLACYVALDIHHGISLDIGIDGVIDTAVRAPSGPYASFIPSPEWMALHLIFKIYWEGVHSYGKGLYQYADLARLVQKMDHRTQAALIHLLEHYRLGPAGYYVLRRLNDGLAMDLPTRMASFLVRASRPETREDPLEVNDLGDMWPKLWGRR